MSASQNNSKKSDEWNGNNATRYEQYILDTSSIGVLITRIGDGTILYANKAIASLLGIADVTSVVGTPVPNFYWDLEDRKAMLERFKIEGSITNNEIRARRIDGSMLWVSISIQPFQFEDEQVLLSEITDVSARKQAEEALHTSEVLFRSIYDNSTIGLYRTTPGGRILMINPTGLRLLGFDSFEEMAQRNLEQAGFEEVDARKKFRERLEREGVIEQESVWTKKDGSPIFVRESSTISRDENDNILYYDGSFEDITAYKKAEDALRLSEERFRRFTEVTVEGLVFHEQGKIVDANPAALAMFGLSDNTEFFGRNLLEFIVPESQKQVLQQMQLEAVLPYEIQCVREDGSIFPVETSTRTFKEGTRIIRASSLRDITDRKQAEQALQENQKFLTLVLDTMPGSLFWKDRNSIYLGSNHLFAKGGGLNDPSEIVGKSDHDLAWTKEEADAYIKDDRDVMESDIPKYHIIEPQLQANGKQTWVDTTKIPLHDAQGNVIGILGTFEDITERKQLEQQVQEAFERRGYQVQVSTEISQEVAAASEINDLFERVVTLTKERLGYYHTQLLRYDIAKDAVVLINGYGEIGQKMLAGGHQMPMGSGLIGTAAATGETILRPTLADDPDWQPNPLLPDTKGEIAVPIKWQNTVLGVLDVQSNQAGALSDEDRLLFEGLCGQIAIAMYSAELVEAIRQNEARLAEALLTARLANWEYTVEKDLFTFNDQFYSIFHSTAEKAGGYQISSARYAELFVHPDDIHLVGAEIEKSLISTERVYNTTIDHRIKYEDGGIGYITVKVTVERDENGKITRYYGANQDITERKQAEEALRRSEQEMAERLEEINRLYQNLSHEGWKSYRETESLPTGFVFDQTGTKIVDDEILADNLFANVPMKVLGGEVVGMLTVANDPRNPTSGEDLAFFQQVSDQIALALEGARLTAQTQLALSQSERLFEASRRLAQVSDLQELVKTTVELFNIPVINGAELDMFSYDAGGELESLSVVANWWNGTGTEPGVIGSRFSKEMFSAVKLFLTSTPVFISDALDSERVDAPMLRIVKTFNIRAVTFLPLFVGTHQMGVLIMHAEEPHNFTEEETRMFSGLAPLIATVLENRRQFERAQQQADRESTLNLISQKIQSATTVEAVLQIAARELGHALGAPMTIAQLSMKDKK